MRSDSSAACAARLATIGWASPRAPLTSLRTTPTSQTCSPSPRPSPPRPMSRASRRSATPAGARSRWWPTARHALVPLLRASDRVVGSMPTCPPARLTCVAFCWATTAESFLSTCTQGGEEGGKAYGNDVFGMIAKNANFQTLGAAITKARNRCNNASWPHIFLWPAQSNGGMPPG